jgi:hypothetical protein
MKRSKRFGILNSDELDLAEYSDIGFKIGNRAWFFRSGNRLTERKTWLKNYCDGVSYKKNLIKIKMQQNRKKINQITQINKQINK